MFTMTLCFLIQTDVRQLYWVKEHELRYNYINLSNITQSLFLPHKSYAPLVKYFNNGKSPNLINEPPKHFDKIYATNPHKGVLISIFLSLQSTASPQWLYVSLLLKFGKHTSGFSFKITPLLYQPLFNPFVNAYSPSLLRNSLNITKTSAYTLSIFL